MPLDQIVWKAIRRFLKDESGPTAVEYAVMLAMIVLMCIGTILSTGDVQKVIWEDSADSMNEALFGSGN